MRANSVRHPSDLSPKAIISGTKSIILSVKSVIHIRNIHRFNFFYFQTAPASPASSSSAVLYSSSLPCEFQHIWSLFSLKIPHNAPVFLAKSPQKRSDFCEIRGGRLLNRPGGSGICHKNHQCSVEESLFSIEESAISLQESSSTVKYCDFRLKYPLFTVFLLKKPLFSTVFY